MKLNKAKGNMFKSVTHTATFCQGCDHGCVYCWAECMGISHEPKLVQKNEYEVLKVRDAVIFLNSAHDSFADCIPNEWISMMLRWIERQDPSNKFLLQTKNTPRLMRFYQNLLKVNGRVRLGTTVETNRSSTFLSKAPEASLRAQRLALIREIGGFETFLSLEPLTDFDLNEMLIIVMAVAPVCIEIGFDNWQYRHGHKLHRPTRRKYLEFTKLVRDMGYEIIEKDSVKEWLR